MFFLLSGTPQTNFKYTAAPPVYRMNLVLDRWQLEFLETVGDKLLCTGRQVGKSVVCAIDAGNYALANPGKTVLMIAPTERQAYALFLKTLDYISGTGRKGLVLKGRNRPTKSRLKLRNGTVIYCLPTGLAGVGIRFLTVDRLYGEEASRIPEAVWDAVTPMLLTTGGDTILLSTPFGSEGFFYDVLINKGGAFDSYTRFRKDSLTVMKERKVSSSWSREQGEKAIQRIMAEKARMTELAFAQEYLGMPLQGLKQVFPDRLLENTLTLSRRGFKRPGRDYYLGQDIAGMGGDDAVWVVLDAAVRNNIEMVECLVRQGVPAPQRVDQTLRLERAYGFRRIGVDDGGLGSADFEYLLTHEATRRKTEALNNASRRLNRDGSRKKRLLKEDMYNNLLGMMEHGHIRLLKDDAIFHSLRSIQFEITGRKVSYHGSDSHIAEALIRAAWLAGKKGLNIYIHSS